MWPFKKNPEPPQKPIDGRVWNEDWKVGDIAECVIGSDEWAPDMPPWERLPNGSRYTVVGFKDSYTAYGPEMRQYFLELEGVPFRYSCNAFRKVRPVSKSEERKAEKSNPVTSDPQWWLDQEPVEEDA